MRPCRSIMRGGRSRSRQKIYRCAFVRPKELLGGISTPTRPCAPTGSGVLPLLCVGSASPKPGVQARESEVSGVLGTRKHRLSRSRRNGPRRHRVVLDRRSCRRSMTTTSRVATSRTRSSSRAFARPPRAAPDRGRRIRRRRACRTGRGRSGCGARSWRSGSGGGAGRRSTSPCRSAPGSAPARRGPATCG